MNNMLVIQLTDESHNKCENFVFITKDSFYQVINIYYIQWNIYYTIKILKILIDDRLKYFNNQILIWRWKFFDFINFKIIIIKVEGKEEE